MKIEEELKKIAKSSYKNNCVGKYAEFYIEDLLVLFDEFAKSYARSLVPEEMKYDENENPDNYDIIAGWNRCREEILRKIEEGCNGERNRNKNKSKC